MRHDRKTLHAAPDDLPNALGSAIEYGKSGLSLNQKFGCPLEYFCSARQLFISFEMKQPYLIVNDETAVEVLTSH